MLCENNMPVKLNGLAKVYAYLESHDDYYRKLTEFIEADLNGHGGDVGNE